MWNPIVLVTSADDEERNYAFIVDCAGGRAAGAAECLRLPHAARADTALDALPVLAPSRAGALAPVASDRHPAAGAGAIAGASACAAAALGHHDAALGHHDAALCDPHTSHAARYQPPAPLVSSGPVRTCAPSAQRKRTWLVVPRRTSRWDGLYSFLVLTL